VSVSPSGIHDENPGVFAYCFGKRFWTGLNDYISPTDLARQRRIQRRTLLIFSVGKFGNNNLIFETRLAGLSFDGTSVHGQISQVP